jgi:two-component system, NarL family, response regulator LiaR
MPQVILADDHPLFLSALELSLTEAGIDVLGSATNGDEVLDLVDAHEPDAVLLDLCMPGMDGVTCIRRLSALYPALRIVVVSATDDQTAIHGALAAGAVCFVGKSVQPEDLVHALRAVINARNGGIHYRGELPVTQLRTIRPERRNTHGLTKRELEILRLAASGSSNSQMAKLLWVTEQTIKFHLSNVYKKLGVPNRTAASAAASKLGLLELDDAADFGAVVDIASARGMLG